MATITDPPKASFRLSMLLYDTRYRSLTIQAIFLLLMMAGAARGDGARGMGTGGTA